MARPIALVDCNNFVRREAARLTVLTISTGQDRLSHQPYPKEQVR